MALIDATDDPKIAGELTDKLLILLAQSKRKDTGKPRPPKAGKAVDNASGPVDSALLGA